jgi:hypothetical protein
LHCFCTELTAGIASVHSEFGRTELSLLLRHSIVRVVSPPSHVLEHADHSEMTHPLSTHRSVLHACVLDPLAIG